MWHDDHIQQREAFVSIIPPLVCHLWEPGDKKIAQLELLQVLYALFSRPSAFRGRRGLWFIDNTAASFHDLHRIAFWSPFGRHVLQSIQSFGGSFVASICILFDEFVFEDAHVTDRKSCKESGQRAMQFMHRASFSFGHVNASSTNCSIS